MGYLCYDMTHYYLHHGSPSAGGYLADLKSYHVAHHYLNPNLGALVILANMFCVCIVHSNSNFIVPRK